MYILFTGCTGVGKSSLINALSRRIPDSMVFSDPYTENPFLNSAYIGNDKAFQSEMFFVKEFMILHDLINKNFINTIFQERSIYECANIFCKMYLAQGKIDENEYKLCESIVYSVSSSYRKPDMIIHLTASDQIIANRISTRNRTFEKGFDKVVVRLQEQLYNEWVYPFAEDNRIQLSVIDTSEKTISDTADKVMDIISSL